MTTHKVLFVFSLDAGHGFKTISHFAKSIHLKGHELKLNTKSFRGNNFQEPKDAFMEKPFVNMEKPWPPTDRQKFLRPNLYEGVLGLACKYGTCCLRILSFKRKVKQKGRMQNVHGSFLFVWFCGLAHQMWIQDFCQIRKVGPDAKVPICSTAHGSLKGGVRTRPKLTFVPNWFIMPIRARCGCA